MSGTSIGNATRLAAASLQATDVIPVERPGVTTPYKTRVSSLATLVNGTIDIRDYGAVGDGITDDTAAIQNAINAAAGTGYAVFIPPTSTFWNVTYAIRVPSNVTIFGVGERSHIKHTGGTVAPAWWPGYNWFAGNMFYVGNMGGEAEEATMPTSPFYHLTWYGIAASPAGTIRITFDTNAEADQFTAGDVVFLKSGAVFSIQITGPYYDVPFDRPLYVQVNIVKAVGDGYVDLVYPLDYNFDASSSIATEAEPYDLYDGTPLYYPRNVTIRDLHLEMTATNGVYAIYGCGIYCNFENLTVDHKRIAIGCNALAYS
ncbi:MAG: glycosyl hydrolase family 28-related protein, partial [Candidatus Paceibacterota bacterium]